ncbi:MAG TPA: hypothetical protein VL125_15930 [Pelobium sp.]|nr:hypothetical protein [Pelobium sp.]
MFERLNKIVKESEQAFLAYGLNENALKDAMHEATGVIVDVLKSQLEHGKAKDLMSSFTGKQSNYQGLTKAMINKYSHRLNRYFNLSIADAKDLSEQVIPVVMSKFVKQTMESKKEENGIFTLMNWLSGNTVNFENFFLKLNVVQVA